MEEGVILEDEPDPTTMRRNRGDVVAVEPDAPCVRPLQARDDPKERALPGAAGPEHGDHLAVADRRA